MLVAEMTRDWTTMARYGLTGVEEAAALCNIGTASTCGPRCFAGAPRMRPAAADAAAATFMNSLRFEVIGKSNSELRLSWQTGLRPVKIFCASADAFLK